MHNLRHTSASGLLSLMIGFTLIAFTFLSFREERFDVLAIVFGLIVAALMLLSYLLLRLVSPHIDRFLILVTYMLFAVGIIMQYRMEPSVAYRQFAWYGVGWAVLLLCTGVMHYASLLDRFKPVIMLVCVGLLGVLLLIGKESGGATNWIVLGNMSFQPSEFVKVALVIVLAGYFHMKMSWVEMIFPSLFCAVCVALLVMERDLGAALLMLGTFLIMYFTATGNVKVTLIGLGAGVGGAVTSYYLFEHVRARVMVWKDPWATYYTSGYQIAQGLMAIASGGFWGLGLMQGSPKTIPAYHTDYIFAVICEEFGIIFGIALIAFYLVFIVRGALIALNANDRFMMLAAFGCTTLITLQSFIIIGGVIKLIPLTGITLPFVSYGGSSVIASMAIVGILEGIAIQSGKKLEEAMEEASQCKPNEI